jgi:glycosyltransferase involved in cell wall biosynthesis
MRVLLVSQYYWPEPFRVADVAAGLRERGHEVEVLTGLPNYPSGKLYPGYGPGGPYTEEHDGVPVRRVPIVPRGGGGALRLLLNYASFAAAGTLRALAVGRRRWDVVFVFQLSPVTAILPAAVTRALYRIPLVAWVQDLWPESVASTGFGRSRALYASATAISRWLYRRCDRLLGTSPAFGARLERLGIPASRFEHLPQWREELLPCSGAALPEGAWSQGFPVLFAGNLGRVQALDTILAAAELTRDDPELRWVFVGDGSLRPWLEDEVRCRGLQATVFLLGRHPPSAMPAFFARAGALLVSLKRDEAMSLTLPGKVQSYLAAGRPLLGSIDGEAARVIHEAGAGLAAPADDGAALADTARRLKALPERERAVMGERGRAYSDRHFARDACLDQLERALVDAAQASRQTTRRT